MADKKNKREQEDKMARDLECFLNQPNINMVIPWVYGIYQSIKSGGGSVVPEVIVKDLEWVIEEGD